jgi:hypothetical protein
MNITVLDPDAGDIVARLRRRFPDLEDAATVSAIDTDLDRIDSEAARAISATHAYVCIANDSEALRAAISLRHGLPRPDALVVVELSQAQGLGRLIARPREARHIHAFSVLDETMAAGLLYGGTYEILAQAVHEKFVEDELEREPTAKKESLAEWEALAPEYKESSRAQAAHFGTKLARLGMTIAPLADWDADTTEFTEEQVEAMAKMEYERFIAERRRSSAGRRRATASPQPSTPWADLDAEEQEKNRQIVRNIPALLVRAGYQVIPGAR